MDSDVCTDICNNKLKEPLKYHRKLWEFVWIYSILEQKGHLVPGKRGIGFGCGEERLVPALAAQGVEIVVSDQDAEAAAKSGWVATNQHSSSLEAFEKFLPLVCDKDLFYKNVSYRCIDMNHLPEDIDGQFDFNWSACSLEHLGTLELGLEFILNSMRSLKPGGVAVHTTEYNISSNDATLTSGCTAIYRRKDIEELLFRAIKMGYQACAVDFSTGDLVHDNHIDVPPYTEDPHLKLEIAGYDCTSIGIFIEKP